MKIGCVQLDRMGCLVQNKKKCEQILQRGPKCIQNPHGSFRSRTIFLILYYANECSNTVWAEITEIYRSKIDSFCIHFFLVCVCSIFGCWTNKWKIKTALLMQCVVVALCITIKTQKQGSRSNWLRKSRRFHFCYIAIYICAMDLNECTRSHSPMLIFELVPFYLLMLIFKFSLNSSQWSLDDEMAAGWKDLCGAMCKNNNWQSAYVIRKNEWRKNKNTTSITGMRLSLGCHHQTHRILLR